MNFRKVLSNRHFVSIFADFVAIQDVYIVSATKSFVSPTSLAAWFIPALLMLTAGVGYGQQAVETVKVVAKPVSRSIKLPGELLPFESVEIYARVQGFVDKIRVDRGSAVKKGDLLAELTAPEMKAQRAEAQAKIEGLRAQRQEAFAKAFSYQATLARLIDAAKTKGAISEQELETARKTYEASQAAVQAVENAIQAAQATERSVADLEGYLRITAPFDGVITERRAHPGALAGPAAPWLVRIEQTAKLRLVVSVPESETATIARGSRVSFGVPAFPGQTFTGSVARFSRTIDPKSRTMPVELDVVNSDGRLGPGMFPEVEWPVRRAGASMLVPQTAVAVNTERSFVIRVKDGAAEWVDVRKGATSGPLVEVTGALHEGDVIVKRASDEMRSGSKLTVK